MIVEQRTYQFQTGGLPRFFALYDETGARALQIRVLGNLLGYFTTEFGSLNQSVHLWGYTSLDDRAIRRARLMEEQIWRGFLAQISTLILSQESKILMPTEFSPLGK